MSAPQVPVLCTGDVMLRILPADRLLYADRRQRLVEWRSVFLPRSVITATTKPVFMEYLLWYQEHRVNTDVKEPLVPIG